MTFSKDELHVLKMCFLALDRDCNAQIDGVDIFGFGVDTPGNPDEEGVQEILRAMGGKPVPYEDSTVRMPTVAN